MVGRLESIAIMKNALPLALFLSSGIAAHAAPVAVTEPVGFTTAGGVAVRVGFTTPVGMLTEHLRPGMNLIGLRLHQTVMASGAIGGIGADFAELGGLNDDQADKLRLAMIEGKTYVLEITSGAKAGVIQEVTQWQGLRLMLADDLAGAGVKTGDKFNLRQCATLNSVFDPRSTRLQAGEGPGTADAVLIPQGAAFGDFRACFILRAPGIPALWVDAATLKPVGDLPLVYPDGLVVRITGLNPVDMVFSGEVKGGPTRCVIKPGLNLLATPYPGCDHLQGLGLENDLSKSDNPMQADQVWVAEASGGGAFTIYFLDMAGHWINANSGEEVAGKIPTGSAVLVDRKGPAALFCLGK